MAMPAGSPRTVPEPDVRVKLRYVQFPYSPSCKYPLWVAPTGYNWFCMPVEIIRPSLLEGSLNSQYPFRFSSIIHRKR